MFNHHHSARPGKPVDRNCRLPEVADHPQSEPEGEEATTPASDDLASFKVFMKRNLRPQAPPADLLAGIRARISDISAAK